METDTQKKNTCMKARDVASELGCSLPSVYNIINREDFPKIRYGRKIIIPRDAFERWLQRAVESGLDLKEPAQRLALNHCGGR